MLFTKGMIDRENVIEGLKECYDPEINIDVWTLGLIYNLELKEDRVNIRMTFTSIMCPYGPMLVEEIKQRISKIESVKEVNVEVVFEPPWQPSDDLRAMLGV